MTFLTAILSVLGAIIGAVAKAAVGFLGWWKDTIPWQVTVGLIVAVLLFAWGVKVGGGGVMPTGCSCKELMCGCRPRPPRPPVTHTKAGTVVSVEAANRFTLKQGRRLRPCTVAYVVVQGDEGIELTRELLPIGGPVSVLCEGRRFLGEASDVDQASVGTSGGLPEAGSPQSERNPPAQGLEGVQNSEEAETTDATDSPGPEDDWPHWDGKSCIYCGGAGFTPSADNPPKSLVCEECGGSGKYCGVGKSPITGIVTGPTGADVGLELCRKGFAQPTADAPAAYKAAWAAKGE
jgi:hypothetical protein